MLNVTEPTGAGLGSGIVTVNPGSVLQFSAQARAAQHRLQPGASAAGSYGRRLFLQHGLGRLPERPQYGITAPAATYGSECYFNDNSTPETPPSPTSARKMERRLRWRSLFLGNSSAGNATSSIIGGTNAGDEGAFVTFQANATAGTHTSPITAPAARITAAPSMAASVRPF